MNEIDEIKKQYRPIDADDLGEELILRVMETENKLIISKHVTAFLGEYESKKFDREKEKKGFLNSSLEYLSFECERIQKSYEIAKKLYKEEKGIELTKEQWYKECKRAVDDISENIRNRYNNATKKFTPRIKALEKMLCNIQVPENKKELTYLQLAFSEFLHLGHDLCLAGIDDYELAAKLAEVVEEKLDIVINEFKERGKISPSDLERAVMSTPAIVSKEISMIHVFKQAMEKDK